MDNAVTTTGESHERELSGCVGPNDTPQMHQCEHTCIYHMYVVKKSTESTQERA
jgi:hypothetical protein